MLTIGDTSFLFCGAVSGKQEKGEGCNRAVGLYSYSVPKQVMMDLPGKVFFVSVGGLWGFTLFSGGVQPRMQRISIIAVVCEVPVTSRNYSILPLLRNTTVNHKKYSWRCIHNHTPPSIQFRMEYSVSRGTRVVRDHGKFLGVFSWCYEYLFSTVANFFVSKLDDAYSNSHRKEETAATVA